MNINIVPPWVPQYLSPFFSLSYRTDPPPKTDSFHDSPYFGTGWLDICTIVGLIAAMAILRDLARIYVFETFARWKLSKDLRAKKLAASKNRGSSSPPLAAKPVSNGVTNGHRVNGDVPEITFTAAEKRKLHRSVLRFAEQGWALLCYSFQCGFGFVSLVFLSVRTRRLIRLGLSVCSPQFPNKNVIPWRGYLVRIPWPLPITWTGKILLPQRNRVLHPRNIHLNCRGEEERSHPDDDAPLRRDHSHVPLLRLELHKGRMSHYGPNGCV